MPNSGMPDRNASIPNPELQTLNPFSETGGMLLADMLDRNGSIHHLDIAANQVSHASLLRIKSECKRRKATASSQEPRALQDQIRLVTIVTVYGLCTTGSDQVSYHCYCLWTLHYRIRSGQLPL